MKQNNIGNRIADKFFASMPPNDAYLLRHKTIFCDVSAAAEWWMTNTQTDEIEWRKDFPTIVSPFECAWYESRYPDKSFAQGRWMDTKGMRTAAYIVKRELSEYGKEKTGARWIQDAAIFINVLKGEFDIIAHIVDLLDDSGLPKFPPEDENSPKQLLILDLSNLNQHQKFMVMLTKVMQYGHRLIFPMSRFLAHSDACELASEMFINTCFGISMLHCKNVEASTETFDPATLTRMNQDRHKQGLSPVIRFKILDVRPLKKKISESESSHSEIKRALHITRGHFKTYTTDAPLFGKLTGTYWWEQFLRGSEKEGIIKKSYRVICE